MKTLLILLSIFCTGCLFTNAQNGEIRYNGKDYLATGLFSFSQNAKTYYPIENQEYVKISIGKNGKKGILILQKTNSEFFNQDVLIGGTLYIYLENNDVITCVDRNNKGYRNNTASSIYLLTESEINLLEKFNIVELSYILYKNNGFEYDGGHLINPIKRFTASSNRAETAIDVFILFNVSDPK